MSFSKKLNNAVKTHLKIGIHGLGTQNMPGKRIKSLSFNFFVTYLPLDTFFLKLTSDFI